MPYDLLNVCTQQLHKDNNKNEFHKLSLENQFNTTGKQRRRLFLQQFDRWLKLVYRLVQGKSNVNKQGQTFAQWFSYKIDNFVAHQPPVQ